MFFVYNPFKTKSKMFLNFPFFTWTPYLCVVYCFIGGRYAVNSNIHILTLPYDWYCYEKHIDLIYDIPQEISIKDILKYNLKAQNMHLISLLVFHLNRNATNIHQKYRNFDHLLFFKLEKKSLPFQKKTR